MLHALTKHHPRNGGVDEHCCPVACGRFSASRKDRPASLQEIFRIAKKPSCNSQHIFRIAKKISCGLAE
jgi:hypothetical protein